MPFSIEKAIRAQILLSKHVIIEPINVDLIDTVIGLDVSYSKDFGCAAAVAYNLKSKTVVNYAVYCDKVQIPYIPGLLAFREAPLMIKALYTLSKKTRVEVVFVNGHGLAHPRLFGIASHIGVVFNIPSVGVARNLLYGKVVQHNGKEAIIVDGRIVGYVLRKNNHKLYVSIGHRVTAENAAELVLRTWLEGKTLPEPIRLADEISRKEVRKLTANL